MNLGPLRKAVFLLSLTCPAGTLWATQCPSTTSVAGSCVRSKMLIFTVAARPALPDPEKFRLKMSVDFRYGKEWDGACLL
jgi:hypothetical protein